MIFFEYPYQMCEIFNEGIMIFLTCMMSGSYSDADNTSRTCFLSFYEGLP